MEKTPTQTDPIVKLLADRIHAIEGQHTRLLDGEEEQGNGRIQPRRATLGGFDASGRRAPMYEGVKALDMPCGSGNLDGCNGAGYTERAAGGPTTRTVCDACGGSGRIPSEAGLGLLRALADLLAPRRLPDAEEQSMGMFNADRAEEHRVRVERDRAELEKQARAERARNLLGDIAASPGALERLEGAVRGQPAAEKARR